jgi:hypothetical protein
MPPELRHLCLTLARFMSGDGSEGCYPGTRKLADRIGVHRATVSRWLHQLVALGWLDRELRKRQFGRLGGHYWPAIPMALHDAPISNVNGASERAILPPLAQGAPRLAHSAPVLARENTELAHVACAGSPTESLTEKNGAQVRPGAATPSPAEAGYAAQTAFREEFRQRFGCYPEHIARRAVAEDEAV